MKKRERRKKIVVVQEEKLESVQGGSGYTIPDGWRAGRLLLLGRLHDQL